MKDDTLLPHDDRLQRCDRRGGNVSEYFENHSSRRDAITPSINGKKIEKKYIRNIYYK
jgi:hypothetical protein